MKLKLLARLTFVFFVIPLVGLALGCGGADNPKITEAPAPPAPKPDEVKPHVAKVGDKKVEYGSNPNYKKAMDRLNK